MAEKLRNCKGCGKLFMSHGSIFCLACIDKQAEEEQQIIDFVSANPDCTTLDIVKALGINENIVRRLIEQGRLLQAGIDYYYPCTRCGAPIASGQYCKECTDRLKAEILAEQEKRENRAGIGMRYRQLVNELEGGSAASE